jgi:hypothetical protein
MSDGKKPAPAFFGAPHAANRKFLQLFGVFSV